MHFVDTSVCSYSDHYLLSFYLALPSTALFNPRRMREGYGTCSVINPRRMREGYGTWFAIRCPSSCREQRSLLRAGKVMT